MTRSLFLQIIAFIMIFQLASWYKERPMLADDVQAQQFSLNNLAGQEQVLIVDKPQQILYFFAPWCTICHLSIENLQYYSYLKPNVTITAIALDYENIAEVMAFVDDHQLTIDVVLGDQHVKHAYQVPVYPSYYTLNNGAISQRSIGYSSLFGLIVRGALG